jgi:hypothetical protein
VVVASGHDAHVAELVEREIVRPQPQAGRDLVLFDLWVNALILKNIFTEKFGKK